MAERRQTAVQLRRQGRSFREIASALGVSVGGAFNDVKSALEALPAADAELHRRETLERLDAAVTGLWSGVTGGDPRAAIALVQVEARRAALLGLDSPVRAEVALAHAETRRRLQLVEELEAKVDAELADTLFETLPETIKIALRQDGERTENVLAKLGFVRLPQSVETDRHSHRAS